MLGNLADLTFVLVDFRERSDYDLYHIKEAISYPAANILRDKFPNEMYNIKNKDGKLIIVYDNEERTGINHSNLIFQKGWDNIYLMSGGLEDFAKAYPEYCEGPGVTALINAKNQLELLKKDAPLRSSNRNITKGMVLNDKDKKARPKSNETQKTHATSKLSVYSTISKARALENSLKKK